jgi:hypothetical protein
MIMRVFISWSGSLSNKIAECIRTWLPGVIQVVQPYFTPSDVEKGARWNTEIAKELEAANFGILCITRENINSNWLMFEAGALSKRLDKAAVCPLLFGLQPSDLTGPLQQFQSAPFEKTEIKKVLSSINSALSDAKLADAVLDSVFEMWWPKLEEQVTKILKEHKGQGKEPIRTERQILEEILELSRLTAKNEQDRKTNIHPDATRALLENYLKVYSLIDFGSEHQKILNGLQEMMKSVLYFYKVSPPHKEKDLNALAKQIAEKDFKKTDLPF